MTTFNAVHLNEEQAFDKFEKIIDVVYECYVNADLSILGSFVMLRDREVYGVDRVDAAMVSGQLIMSVMDGDTIYTAKLFLG